MRSMIFAAAALALTVPSLAMADDAASSPANLPVKEKKFCRYTPPPTGSNRPGKRRCRTAAQWQIEDRETRETGDVAAGTNGAPARSQPQNNN
ncbi:MAG: hypothetical protein WBL74_09840 [Novosphingobium sp.]|uniref:hypothetical protein n=1 Tax=Novosphingobium sp. TaxID=1874826 RepID=UPI003C7AC32B